MAVSNHLGLYLPTREDYISVKRDLSDNFELIDASAEMLENGSAIVIDGDTAPKNITVGQYLLIKNHSSLASGAYHATANISASASITSSNVTADSDGLSNALNSNITNIQTEIGVYKYFEFDISGTDDYTVIATACNIMVSQFGASGHFTAKVMRTEAHMIMGWGVIRNAVLYGQFQAYNSNSNNIYVCMYDLVNGLSIIRTI